MPCLKIEEPDHVNEPKMYIAWCLATKSEVYIDPSFLVVHLSAILHHWTNQMNHEIS